MPKIDHGGKYYDPKELNAHDKELDKDNEYSDITNTDASEKL